MSEDRPPYGEKQYDPATDTYIEPPTPEDNPKTQDVPEGMTTQELYEAYKERNEQRDRNLPYTPILGYHQLSMREIATINALKETEGFCLKQIAELRDGECHDARWISIGQTHIEQAFMALARSVAQPVPIADLPARPTITADDLKCREMDDRGATDKLGEHSIG